MFVGKGRRGRLAGPVTHGTGFFLPPTCTQSLAQSAETYLVGLWAVPRMAPNATFLSSMVNVKLPTDNSTQCGIIRSQLLAVYNMSVSGWTAVDGFPCYLRLSAQVYLDMTDFERLGDAVLAILKQLTSSV